MAINSYSTLQTSITSWLHRDDLNAVIPDFIMLFEQEANRRLRVREQEATATIAITNSVGTLPADYLVWRNVYAAASTNTVLEYVTPQYLATKSDGGAPDGGTPSLFTIVGNQLQLAGTSSAGNVVMNYFQEIPPLSAAAPTNWLLLKHPDVYLFGSLTEAHGFAMDPDALGGWAGRREILFEEIQALSNKSRGVGGIKIIGMPTP